MSLSVGTDDTDAATGTDTAAVAVVGSGESLAAAVAPDEGVAAAVPGENTAATAVLVDSVITVGDSGSAVKDIQQRLESIGYDLGDEPQNGIFGELTATAVAAFRAAAGLNAAGGERDSAKASRVAVVASSDVEDASAAADGSVDRITWAALVDASFTFGDRLLYLRVPHFHGKDVNVLQTALAALGFSCLPDGIFGALTEHAVREFQQNAGINGDGIVGDSTFAAINRLRHAWEDRDILRAESVSAGFARAAEVLESRAFGLYGADELSRSIAARIANLAMATTSGSLTSQMQGLEQVNIDDYDLLIKIIQGESDPTADSQDGDSVIPLVVFDSDVTINARMATAVGLTSATQPRIVVVLTQSSQAAASGEAGNTRQPSANKQPGTQTTSADGRTAILSTISDPHDAASARVAQLSPREEQHIAIAILDALCLAFS